MTNNTLRERDKRVLFYIRTFQWEKRYSPTAGDIASMFAIDRKVIMEIVQALKRKGYIEMSPHTSWVHRRILFPKGMSFPWGNHDLPDDIFAHMHELERKYREKNPDVFSAQLS